MPIFKSCFGADPKLRHESAATTAKTNNRVAEHDFSPRPLERRETAYDKKMRQDDERKASRITTTSTFTDDLKDTFSISTADYTIDRFEVHASAGGLY
jgi:hypothetical protein